MRAHAGDGILSRMADGALDFRARTFWERHVGDCAPCRARAEVFRRVQGMLKGLPTVEINPLEQLQPQVFVPVVQPAFPWWGFAAGLTMGVVLVAAFTVLRPIHSPMRMVSTSDKLVPGQPLNSQAHGDIDLEIADRMSFRLKPGTTVTWQETDRLWLLGGRPNIVLNVMQGELLARTHENFWGSQLQIRTPTADATVRGTAFSIQVEPKQDATTLKVLAGSVFLSPYLDRVGIEVGAGRSGRVEGRKLESETLALSSEERAGLLETYRIGRSPRVALVVGGGPERLEELLEPALLYWTLKPDSSGQPFLMVRAQELNRAILEGRLASAEGSLRGLEIGVQEMTDPELAVPLRLFLGACNVRMGYPRRGRLHFQWVILSAPHHPLASLALAAAGRTTELYLHNPEGARSYFRELLARYPKTPEADSARKFFHRSKSR